LVQKIRQRFGSEGQEERYQAELRARRRRKGESLQSLYQDIRRLMSLAYPGETSRMSEQIAKDAFLIALDDARLELRCREQEPKDLDTAHRTALRFEQYEKAVGSFHGTVQANRRVQAEREGDRMSKLEQQVNEMQNAMKQQGFQNRAARSYGQPNHPPVTDVNYPQSTNGGYPVNDTPTGRRVPICYGCSQPGHKRFQCPWRDAPSVPTTANYPNPVQSQSMITPSVSPPQLVSQNTECNMVTGRSNVTNTRKPGSSYLSVFINGRNELCLVDSGCEISMFPKRLITDSMITPTDLTMSNASGLPLIVSGETNVELICGDVLVNVHGVVSESVQGIILGHDFLVANDVDLKVSKSRLYMHDREFILFTQDSTGQCRNVTLDTPSKPFTPERNTCHGPDAYDIHLEPLTRKCDLQVIPVAVPLGDHVIVADSTSLSCSSMVPVSNTERLTRVGGNENNGTDSQRVYSTISSNHGPDQMDMSVQADSVGLCVNADHIGETEINDLTVIPKPSNVGGLKRR